MSNKVNPSKTRQMMTDPAGLEIQRLWGNVPVYDATKELRVFIRPDDLATAVRKDPGACVFAQACKRLFSTTKVLFYKTVAYIELPGEDGEKRVERFSMAPGMRALVESFDRGEGIIPEAGFVLKPPKRSEKLEYERNKSATSRESAKRRKLLGTMRPRNGNQGKGRYELPSIAVDLSVRSGIGAVHFTCKKEEIKRINRQLAEELKNKRPSGAARPR
jgi:hypothetical protein